MVIVADHVRKAHKVHTTTDTVTSYLKRFVRRL